MCKKGGSTKHSSKVQEHCFIEVASGRDVKKELVQQNHDGKHCFSI